MKPIEPGCLAVITGGSLKVLISTVVTVMKRVPDGSFSNRGELINGGWIIQSQLTDSIIKANNTRMMVASEKILRRIDDGDFDPAADGEENPYTQQVSARWTPARQV